MHTTIRTALATTLTAGLLALAGPVNAIGFNICEKVTISVANASGAAIQVYDVDYYDYSRDMWRSEPTVNRVVNPGRSWSDRRNLEKVEDSPTKIRIKYRTVGSNGRWKSGGKAYSGRFECNKGDRVTVTIS